MADDPAKLGMLHAVLVDQCRIMGAKPYPYLLHRAHETAVVSNEEKLQVEQMLAGAALKETRTVREADGDPLDDGWTYRQSATSI